MNLVYHLDEYNVLNLVMVEQESHWHCEVSLKQQRKMIKKMKNEEHK